MAGRKIMERKMDPYGLGDSLVQMHNIDWPWEYVDPY